MKTCFMNLKRMPQIAIVFILIGTLSATAYGISVLWSNISSTTNFEKDKYIKIEMSGIAGTGSVKPGDSVSLSPALTNNGDIDVNAFVKVTMPTVSDVSAYTFEAGSGWNLVDADNKTGVIEQIWSWGDNTNLEALSPGASTGPLATSFTMKSDISGADFAAMSDINITFEGYMVEVEGTGTSDPESVWYMIPENE